ncbi:formin-like protein 14 [Hordeum vulgare]|nr:formin-like protein 14 [Hordeum vulgare]
MSSPLPPRVHTAAATCAARLRIYKMPFPSPVTTHLLSDSRRRHPLLFSPLFVTGAYSPCLHQWSNATPGYGAAANGFGRRHLHDPEARILYEAYYPAPPDMRVPSSWRLSAGGVPVPPLPFVANRRTEITRIRASLPESSRNLPRYVPNRNTLWTAYFERRQQWC